MKPSKNEVLQYIADNPKSTTAQISNNFGCIVHEISKLMKNYVQTGMLVQVLPLGSQKQQYELTKKGEDYLKGAVMVAIVELLSKAPDAMRNETITRRLKICHHTITKTLKQLEADGVIVNIGATKTAEWKTKANSDKAQEVARMRSTGYICNGSMKADSSYKFPTMECVR